MLGPDYAILEKALPDDHAGMSSAETLLGETLRDHPDGALDLLDFGCGTGHAADLVERLRPGTRYVGVDIEGSPEVLSRTRSDAAFHSYDGRTLPFANDSFDIVYSRQVFEHVRHPDIVMTEIARVLRPGGVFVGSLSNLEPYHSYSIFNYTPYGVHCLVEEAGLVLRTLRPGVEGLTLIVRQLTNRRISGFRLVYPAIHMVGRLRGWGVAQQSYLKLRFSGHICFKADKPSVT